MARRAPSVAQARAELEQAAARLAEAERQEQYLDRLYQVEPANRRIVKFSARFAPGGTVYSFAAIRADNYRGPRRWFTTQNNAVDKPVVLPSPATWAELVQFAILDTLYVAPASAHWMPVSVPVDATSEGSEASPEMEIRVPRGLVRAQDLDQFAADATDFARYGYPH